MNVGQPVVLTKWFFGKELAFAMGLNVSMSRFGGSLAGFFSFPKMSVMDALIYILVVGVFIQTISFLFTISLGKISF